MAQTNLPWNVPAPGLQPIPDAVTVTNIWQAIMAVAHYAGFSAKEIGALFLIAKFLVNYPLKNSSNQIANIISHIALEGSIFKQTPTTHTVSTGSVIPFASAFTVIPPGGQSGTFNAPSGIPVNTDPGNAVQPSTAS